MTTNAGAETGASNTFGFPGSRDDAKSYEKMKEDFKSSIEKYFRPEFLNRLDDIIVFHSLNRENLRVIIDIELGKVRGRLRERGSSPPRFISARGWPTAGGVDDLGSGPSEDRTALHDPSPDGTGRPGGPRLARVGEVRCLSRIPDQGQAERVVAPADHHPS